MTAKPGILASVRRAAGGWSPLDLSPAVWLDASNTGSITQSAGAVSQLNDLSGNGRHATQSSAGLRPTTGTRTQNGLNVLDHAADYLVIPSLTLAQPVTIALVAQRDGTSGNGYLGTQTDGIGGTSDRLTLVANSFNLTASAGTNLVYGAFGTSWCLIVAVYNGASSELYVNGSLVASGNAGTGINNARPMRLGRVDGSADFDGGIGETLIIPGAITSGDRSDLDTYAIAKWGL